MASTLENALRLVKPGEMVVSLTDILDKLGSKLTADEKQQLLIAMLSPRREKVQPGELISSDLLNQTLIDVADLQIRVATLENSVISNKETKITDLLPTANRHIGDTLHIIGEGFNAPTGTTVTIDNIGVQTAPGGNLDREIVVTIPNLQGVPEAGRNVTLIVTNANGTAKRDFVVIPAVVTVPEGQIFVVMSEPPADTRLLAGQSYTFTYTVQAIANLDETYLLTASIDTGWTTQIVNAADSPITGEVQIPAAPPPAGATQTVRVRVSIPLGVPDETTGLLRLTVTSRRNPAELSGHSGGETITVNHAPPTPMDVTITLGEVTRTVATQPVPSTTGNVVRIGATTANYRITFSAQIRADTVYTVALVAPADTLWFVSLSGSATPMLQKTIGPVAAATNQPIYVFVHAGEDAPDAEITFSLTSTTDASKFGRIIQTIGLLL